MSQKEILVSQEELSKKDGMFSKKNMQLIKDPLNSTNPITVQVLGICSALAVTTQVKPSLVMAISVTAVIVLSSFVISLLRNMIPSRIRIIVELVVVASLVILVDQTLKAFLYDVSKQLSVFVGLIITNCIILGRLEAFSLGNKPWPSILDGFGSSLGYAWVLIAIGVVRELFGSGNLYGYKIIPQSFYDAGYVNNGVMLIPAGAAIVVGIIIWVQRTISPTVEEA
ncbi:MAG: Na+-transporting NADH:ubiquinone oxidoreductase subunit D [Sphingobacteriales bacterium]|jgi:Na+-transporting NADH:ubiquinone oxidoreductase subunit D